MKLQHSHTIEKAKGHALIAETCDTMRCDQPFAYIDENGLKITSRHGAGHPGMLTARDLRKLADFVDGLTEISNAEEAA